MRHEPVILIADSKEIFDEMVPVISEKLGTSHIMHVDSLAAAESILDSHIRFDIVFVDWQLVGARFVDAMRRDKKNGCTPLVVMSELDTDVVIATATRHGANGFLAKPFLTKKLANKIEQIVIRQERRRNKRLCPDHPLRITMDTERAGAVEGTLIDFSLDYCHISLDYSHRERMIAGDTARVQLNIDPFSLDLESRLVRVEVDKSRIDESILVLYQFTASHEQREEMFEGLLDEYQAK
jgi:DNA-binding response OmpR family regulator